MLPKFSGTEDPYLFIREFEELCATLRLQQLSDDSIRSRLITFALRDNAKKLLYELLPSSITTWGQLVAIFLRKYFPAHKTTKFRMEIIQTKQGEHELLWQYLERFKELLLQCPHHGFEMWRLTQIVYEGLNCSTKTMVETMCGGEFCNKNVREAWDFLGEVAEKSMQWEAIRTPEVPTPFKGGIYPIAQVPETDARLSAVIRRIEALELRPTPKPMNSATSQVCLVCCATDHSVENCPSDQAYALYQKPRSDPFAPTYNQGWKQHPNLSYSTAPHQGGPQAPFHPQTPQPFNGQPQAQFHQQAPQPFPGQPQSFQGPPQRPFQPQSSPLNVQTHQASGPPASFPPE